MSGPSVAIVGGGLSGLAAAAALADGGCRVELFEARRYLGGRAASFLDRQTGHWLDHCQHVALGCCSAFADLCRRLRLEELFARQRTLHFFGPQGQHCTVRALGWLPAPLHLARGLFGLTFLSLGDRLAIGRAMLALARMGEEAAQSGGTFGRWLGEAGQSAAAVERFWSVIVVSALSESVERASLSAARKVFVDGFLASRSAYELVIPRVPLSEIYAAARQRLSERGVAIRLATPVAEVSRAEGGSYLLPVQAGPARPFDRVVLAVAWQQLADVLAPSLAAALPWVAALERIEPGAIASVHLWFDRPITELRQAVLVGRLSQWVFARSSPGGDEDAYYYQVVISAAHALVDASHPALVERVCRELAEVWPAARPARLLRSRVVAQPAAVFAPLPDSDRLRPAQTTPLPGLYVAGDWTATGWPSTMESAVRSGYLAAAAILADVPGAAAVALPAAPRGWFFRLLGGR